MKDFWKISTFALTVVSAGLLYETWFVQRENHKLSFMNWTYQAEHRLLKDEIRELEQKPTYENGYKDALIKMGGPQNPGPFQDGWEAAMKVVGYGSYTTGYHTAIQQFGYRDSKYYLVSAPTKEEFAKDN